MMNEVMEVQVQGVNENDYVNVLEVASDEVEECVCSKCGVTYFRVMGSNRPKTVCKKCWYGNLSKKGKKMEYTVKDGIATFTTSQGIEFTVDEELADKVAEHTWYFDDGRYIKTHIKKKVVYLHRFVMGLLDSDNHEGLVVDHKISVDKLNNCKSNLRWCTQQDNTRNRKGVKGYSKTSNGKYDADIKIGGKSIHLGTYDTPEHARAVRIMAEKEHFGQYSPNVHLYNDPEILRLYEEAKYEIKRQVHSKYNEYTINGDVVIIKASNVNEEFIIDLEDLKLIENYTWRIHNGNVVNGETQLLARFLMGLTKGDKKRVTFIDGNKFNFRRENLQVVECKTKTKKESNQRRETYYK